MRNNTPQHFISVLRQVKYRPYLIFAAYTVAILLFYHQVFEGYFEGDEWYYFTHFLPFTRDWYGIFPALYKSIVDTAAVSGGGHLTPIYNGLWFLFNQVFGLNYLPYILASVALHVCNTYLLYLLASALTKNRFNGFLAGLFFALTAAHYQAISWVMNFIPTQLSVTFFLLSLIQLTKYLHASDSPKHSISALRLCFLFTVLALLTKENTIILLALIPFTIYLIDRTKLSKPFWRLYFVTTFVYLPFRFGIPSLIEWLNQQRGITSSFTPAVIEPSLYLFRAITYPVKVLVETFIPWRWILNTTEFLAPYAYPTYGAEQQVRGTNFLIFTQSAGSDMLIYVFGTAIICLLVSSLRSARRTHPQDSHLLTTTLGITIIVFSSLPLLLIATYAPSWAYVTFIDSRHLYLASIGGALIFQRVVFPRPKVSYLLVAVLISVWGLIQYSSLQTELNLFTKLGRERKAVLTTVLHDVPQVPDKTAFLILSDSGYYGFGLIPPFQTNFGQVLAVHYYAKQQLPVEILQGKVFSQSRLTDEGYVMHQDRGFGYFLTESKLINTAIEQTIPDAGIFAFTWTGKSNTLTNISPDIRTKIQAKKQQLSHFQDWQKLNLSTLRLSMAIPAQSQLTHQPANDPNVLAHLVISNFGREIEIKAHKKTLNIGIYEDISYLNDSTGSPIGVNSYLRNLPMLYGDHQTAKVTTLGNSIKYFIPTLIPNTIIEVTAIGEPAVLHKAYAPIEEIISHMRYQEGS